MEKYEIPDLLDDESIFITNAKPQISVQEIEELETTPKKQPTKFTRNNHTYIKTAATGIFKRADGTGFAFRAKSTKPPKYDSFVEVDSYTGKPFPTLESAKFARADFMKAKRNPISEIKMRTFGDVWAEFQETNNGRSPETIRRYNSIFDIHIKNVFGDTDITKIKTEEINEFLRSMYWWGDTKQHTSDKTRKNTKKGGYTLAYVESFIKFFYLVMGYAWRMEYITTDQFKRFEDIIESPKSKKKSDNKKIRVLTTEQIYKIEELLKNTDFYVPFVVSLMCGTRPAETFALTFDDFDFTNNILNIDKQIVNENSTLVLKPPKTIASTRKIEFLDKVRNVVLAQQETLLREKRANPIAFEQNRGKVYNILNMEAETIDMPDFICRDKKGRYVAASSFTYYSKIIRKEICPDNDEYEDFSFYTFRKTHLSNMAAHNCPIGELMKRVGHSKMETLYNYYYNRTETSGEILKQALESAEEIL